jgi:hypothetical protein
MALNVFLNSSGIVILFTFLGEKEIGVSNMLVPANIVVVGWCLQVSLSWCSGKGIGVSFRLVPVNIVTNWCL